MGDPPTSSGTGKETDSVMGARNGRRARSPCRTARNEFRASVCHVASVTPFEGNGLRSASRTGDESAIRGLQPHLAAPRARISRGVGDFAMLVAHQAATSSGGEELGKSRPTSPSRGSGTSFLRDKRSSVAKFLFLERAPIQPDLTVLRAAGLVVTGYGRLYSLAPAHRPAPGAATLDLGPCLIKLTGVEP